MGHPIQTCSIIRLCIEMYGAVFPYLWSFALTIFSVCMYIFGNGKEHLMHLLKEVLVPKGLCHKNIKGRQPKILCCFSYKRLTQLYCYR